MVQKDKIVELSQSDPEPCPAGTEVGVVDVQSAVEEHSVVAERTGRRKFISGVVEGEFNVPELHCLLAWNAFLLRRTTSTLN